MSAFQPIFDRAQSLSINKTRRVSQTVSRDGTVKATSLGGQIWEFVVEFPNNQDWRTMRPIIEAIEAADRVTPQTVNLSSPGHEWIVGYQGDLSSTGGIQVSASTGNSVTIVSGATGLSPGQFKFRAGDLIQLSGGGVYSVVNDVAHDDTVIVLHRPLRETPSTYTLSVGQNVNWNVMCVQLPQWTLTSQYLVSWDGPFIFAEVV